MTNAAGRVETSRIITAVLAGNKLVIRPTVVSNELFIQSPDQYVVRIVNSNGSVVSRITLKRGGNFIDVSPFSNGIYYIALDRSKEKQPFIINR
jgi:hypothetical protein